MDMYSNFQELALGRTEGVDYIIDTENRGTDVAVVGIHGGRIEPGTAEIVRAIAQDDLSYYILIGKQEGQHITSIRFDEDRCMDLIARSRTVVTIHGKKGAEAVVMLGGRDADLISKAEEALKKAGFTVLPTDEALEGDQKENICNKGSSGKGMQVEISRGLREILFHDTARRTRFAQAVRSTLR